MRQFKIEGKNKIITSLKRSKQKLFIHSRSQKVSLPNTLPRGFKHLAGAPQERPASNHQEWTRCFFLHNTSFQEAHTNKNIRKSDIKFVDWDKKWGRHTQII